MIRSGNLLDNLPRELAEEQVTELLRAGSLRIERIVSRGHATPPGSWYDQDWDEWVLLIDGSAELLFEDEPAPRRLHPGDYIHIPAHARHRVAATDPSEPTVWLAVHHR